MAHGLVGGNNNNRSAPKSYPFSRILVCEQCGKHYKRKVTATGIVWICSTFNSLGKSFCSSKQIPEETLKQVSAEALKPLTLKKTAASKKNTANITSEESFEPNGSNQAFTEGFDPNSTNQMSAVCFDPMVLEQVEYIKVCSGNTLLFVLKNGEQISRTWQNRSRSKSWTPEMREEARMKKLKTNQQKHAET